MQRNTREVGTLCICKVLHWHNPIWLWCFLFFLFNDEQSMKKYLRSVLKILTLVPEIALTRVDLPCATWPIVPIFWVACLEIISGVNGVISSKFSWSRLCWAKWGCSANAWAWIYIILFLSISKLSSIYFYLFY